jgi:bifunctional enzyme CysN/CysC
MAVITPPRGSVPLAASDLLRFVTAGSVDDGKSTLIGRLLHDAKGIFEDQLSALETASRRRGKAEVDLSLLTDGLRAEREQGITIDVAYRYFATPRRKFVIADTPGHVQYTRNMVTGASTAGLAIVLIDARRGVVEQTRRHTIVAALLGVPHVVAAVNKMDLVGWSEEAFAAIQAEFIALAGRLGIVGATAIPVSALRGDNVVEPSDEMPWYGGRVLLDFLETVALGSPHDLERVRFPVQWVVRASTADHPDYRGYAGRVEGGVLRPGDAVRVLPSGIETRIRSVETFDGQLDEAAPPMSVVVRLKDDVDLGRGAMLVGPADGPLIVRNLDAIVCWLADAPLQIGARYTLQHTTRSVRAVVEAVLYRLDVTTLERDPTHSTLRPNDVGRVRLRLAEPLFVDPYRSNRVTGSAILIDESTNATVGAVLVQTGDEVWP